MEQTNISLFDFQDKSVRVFGTTEEPWFVAKDIGDILGITNYNNFVSSLEPEEKGIHSMDTLGGGQKMTLISESALYQMIFQSRKEEAKKFKKWVFSDLLPTLRRTGKYEMETKIQELENKIKDYEKKQFITDDDKFIMVSDRIIELGYISQKDYGYLMRPNYIEIKKRICKINHPDKSKLQSHLMNISKIMSSKKMTHDKKYPEIRRRDRRNAYYLSDYESFGDDVIRRYFDSNPLNTWQIDYKW